MNTCFEAHENKNFLSKFDNQSPRNAKFPKFRNFYISSDGSWQIKHSVHVQESLQEITGTIEIINTLFLSPPKSQSTKGEISSGVNQESKRNSIVPSQDKMVTKFKLKDCIPEFDPSQDIFETSQSSNLHSSQNIFETAKVVEKVNDEVSFLNTKERNPITDIGFENMCCKKKKLCLNSTRSKRKRRLMNTRSSSIESNTEVKLSPPTKRRSKLMDLETENLSLLENLSFSSVDEMNEVEVKCGGKTMKWNVYTQEKDSSIKSKDTSSCVDFLGLNSKTSEEKKSIIKPKVKSNIGKFTIEDSPSKKLKLKIGCNQEARTGTWIESPQKKSSNVSAEVPGKMNKSEEAIKDVNSLDTNLKDHFNVKESCREDKLAKSISNVETEENIISKRQKKHNKRGTVNSTSTSKHKDKKIIGSVISSDHSEFECLASDMRQTICQKSQEKTVDHSNEHIVILDTERDNNSNVTVSVEENKNDFERKNSIENLTIQTPVEGKVICLSNTSKEQIYDIRPDTAKQEEPEEQFRDKCGCGTDFVLLPEKDGSILDQRKSLRRETTNNHVKNCSAFCYADSILRKGIKHKKNSSQVTEKNLKDSENDSLDSIENQVTDPYVIDIINAGAERDDNCKKIRSDGENVYIHEETEILGIELQEISVDKSEVNTSHSRRDQNFISKRSIADKTRVSERITPFQDLTSQVDSENNSSPAVANSSPKKVKSHKNIKVSGTEITGKNLPDIEENDTGDSDETRMTDPPRIIEIADSSETECDHNDECIKASINNENVSVHKVLQILGKELQEKSVIKPDVNMSLSDSERDKNFTNQKCSTNETSDSGRSTLFQDTPSQAKNFEKKPKPGVANYLKKFNLHTKDKDGSSKIKEQNFRDNKEDSPDSPDFSKNQVTDPKVIEIASSARAERDHYNKCIQIIDDENVSAHEETQIFANDLHKISVDKSDVNTSHSHSERDINFIGKKSKVNNTRDSERITTFKDPTSEANSENNESPLVENSSPKKMKNHKNVKVSSTEEKNLPGSEKNYTGDSDETLITDPPRIIEIADSTETESDHNDEFIKTTIDDGNVSVNKELQILGKDLQEKSVIEQTGEQVNMSLSDSERDRNFTDLKTNDIRDSGRSTPFQDILSQAKNFGNKPKLAVTKSSFKKGNRHTKDKDGSSEIEEQNFRNSEEDTLNSCENQVTDPKIIEIANSAGAERDHYDKCIQIISDDENVSVHEDTQILSNELQEISVHKSNVDTSHSDSERDRNLIGKKAKVNKTRDSDRITTFKDLTSQANSGKNQSPLVASSSPKKTQSHNVEVSTEMVDQNFLYSKENVSVDSGETQVTDPKVIEIASATGTERDYNDKCIQIRSDDENISVHNEIQISSNELQEMSVDKASVMLLQASQATSEKNPSPLVAKSSPKETKVHKKIKNRSTHIAEQTFLNSKEIHSVNSDETQVTHPIVIEIADSTKISMQQKESGMDGDIEKKASKTKNPSKLLVKNGCVKKKKSKRKETLGNNMQDASFNTSSQDIWGKIVQLFELICESEKSHTTKQQTNMKNPISSEVTTSSPAEPLEEDGSNFENSSASNPGCQDLGLQESNLNLSSPEKAVTTTENILPTLTDNLSNELDSRLENSGDLEMYSNRNENLTLNDSVTETETEPISSAEKLEKQQELLDSSPSKRCRTNNTITQQKSQMIAEPSDLSEEYDSDKDPEWEPFSESDCTRGFGEKKDKYRKSKCITPKVNLGNKNKQKLSFVSSTPFPKRNEAVEDLSGEVENCNSDMDGGSVGRCDVENTNYNHSSLTNERVLEEIQSQLIKSENELEALKNLRIVVDWRLSPLHKIDTGSAKTSAKKLKEMLGPRHSKLINENKFSTEDENKIKKGWKEFSEIYNITDPELFFPSSQNIGCFPRKERLKFKLFLAKYLPDRRLRSVYLKFIALFGVQKKGRWSDKEDRLLLDIYYACQKSKTEGSKTVLGVPEKKIMCKALGRTLCSVSSRLDILLGNDNAKSLTQSDISWTPELEGALVHRLLKKAQVDNIEDLRHAKINYEVWRKVVSKLDLPVEKVINHWKYHLYPQLFAQQPVLRRDLQIELIKWLYNSDIEESNQLNWKDISRRAGDLGSCYLYRVYRAMVGHYVPKEFRKNLRDTVMYLREYLIPKLKKKSDKEDVKTYMLIRKVYDPNTRKLVVLEEDEADLLPFRIQ